MDENKMTEEEMNKEAEIVEEILQDNALDDYVSTGGSAVKILESVCHDVCYNYCKYGDLWDECQDERPEPCKNCPLDKLGTF